MGTAQSAFSRPNNIRTCVPRHIYLRFFRFPHDSLLAARHLEPRLTEHGWDSPLIGTYWHIGMRDIDGNGEPRQTGIHISVFAQSRSDRRYPRDREEDRKKPRDLALTRRH